MIGDEHYNNHCRCHDSDEEESEVNPLGIVPEVASPIFFEALLGLPFLCSKFIIDFFKISEVLINDLHLMLTQPIQEPLLISIGNMDLQLQLAWQFLDNTIDMAVDGVNLLVDPVNSSFRIGLKKTVDLESMFQLEHGIDQIVRSLLYLLIDLHESSQTRIEFVLCVIALNLLLGFVHHVIEVRHDVALVKVDMR